MYDAPLILSYILINVQGFMLDQGKKEVENKYIPTKGRPRGRGGGAKRTNQNIF